MNTTIGGECLEQRLSPWRVDAQLLCVCVDKGRTLGGAGGASAAGVVVRVVWGGHESRSTRVVSVVDVLRASHGTSLRVRR